MCDICSPFPSSHHLRYSPYTPYLHSINRPLLHLFLTHTVVHAYSFIHCVVLSYIVPLSSIPTTVIHSFICSSAYIFTHIYRTPPPVVPPWVITRHVLHITFLPPMLLLLCTRWFALFFYLCWRCYICWCSPTTFACSPPSFLLPGVVTLPFSTVPLRCCLFCCSFYSFTYTPHKLPSHCSPQLIFTILLTVYVVTSVDDLFVARWSLFAFVPPRCLVIYVVPTFTLRYWYLLCCFRWPHLFYYVVVLTTCWWWHCWCTHSFIVVVFYLTYIYVWHYSCWCPSHFLLTFVLTCVVVLMEAPEISLPFRPPSPCPRVPVLFCRPFHSVLLFCCCRWWYRWCCYLLRYLLTSPDPSMSVFHPFHTFRWPVFIHCCTLYDTCCLYLFVWWWWWWWWR